MRIQRTGCSEPRERAFTLVEMVIAAALMAMLVGSLITGYIQSCQRSEWSGCSLAAQSLAMHTLEQTRAAKWDPLGFPPTDDLTNNNSAWNTQEILDIPSIGTNVVYGTNVTTISLVSTVPPLKKIKVVCSWPFRVRGVFSNTVMTYRAPDQ